MACEWVHDHGCRTGIEKLHSIRLKTSRGFEEEKYDSGELTYLPTGVSNIKDGENAENPRTGGFSRVAVGGE